MRFHVSALGPALYKIGGMGILSHSAAPCPYMGGGGVGAAESHTRNV